MRGQSGLHEPPRPASVYTLQVTTCGWLPKVKFCLELFQGLGNCGKISKLEIDPNLPQHTSVVFLEINTQLLRGSGEPISSHYLPKLSNRGNSWGLGRWGQFLTLGQIL